MLSLISLSLQRQKVLKTQQSTHYISSMATPNSESGFHEEVFDEPSQEIEDLKSCILYIFSCCDNNFVDL